MLTDWKYKTFGISEFQNLQLAKNKPAGDDEQNVWRIA
jgi:hypothetical protein